MAARQQLPNEWLNILRDLTDPGVNIFRATVRAKDTIDQSAVGKEDDHVTNRKRGKASKGVEEEIFIFSRSKKITAENSRIVMDSELVARISSFLGIPYEEPRFPKKPRKSHRSFQADGCDESPPTEATSETRPTLEALSSVGSAEKETVQHLQDVNDCGYFDYLGSQVKRWLNFAGESKIEVKVSAGKEEPGTKQTGAIQNAGTAETKSQQTKELKAKASNKSNDNEERSAKTKSKATDVKAGKETGVEKELKAAEKELKASEEELKAAEKELKATEKELKATEQELKATLESYSRKKAKATKRTDNQEEKESSRPGSKNVRTCMTCGLQEPAPKVFKKCKRCKDECCLNPPYYCGRDCQVLDWTARHRQEHEKNLDAGDLTTS